MYEIEHKFIIDNNHLNDFVSSNFIKKEIQQGYVIDDSKQGVLRVRIVNNDKAFLTYKKETNEHGKMIEVEVEISMSEANLLFDSCERRIAKTRYIVPFANNEWEIDVFGDRLDGLIVAEIEIPTVDYTYEKPEWLGKDVTGIYQFSNYNLAKYNLSDLKDWL